MRMPKTLRIGRRPLRVKEAKERHENASEECTRIAYTLQINELDYLSGFCYAFNIYDLQ